MSRFEKEIERLVSDRYKDHEVIKQDIQKWGNGLEKDINTLEQKSKGFEKELESRFAKMEKWLSSKHREFEKRFGD